jgi:type III pantothenate kinase
MILCLDSGNTRLKWGLHDGQRWRVQGTLAREEIGRLAELAEQWPAPTQAMLANVAGPAVAAAIRQALAGWGPELREVTSAPQAAGVSNGYREPARLGVDRWCALIGARHLQAGPVLVVMAGTATTIDTLDATGHFRGGLILPGLDLMRRALARDTAALPLAEGDHTDYPRRTEDAIVSGCLEAQAGAIERAYARLPGVDGRCLLSGGNAERLADLLTVPHAVVANLPLEGLRQLAAEV